jgi:hypothetical protein
MTAGSYYVGVTISTTIGSNGTNISNGPAINAPAVASAPVVADAEPQVSLSGNQMVVNLALPVDLGGTAARSFSCTAHDVADGASTTNDVTTAGYANATYQGSVILSGQCIFSSVALLNQSYWNFLTNSTDTRTIPAAGLTVGHTYTFTASTTNTTGTSLSSAVSSFQQLFAGGAGKPTGVVTTGATGSAGGLSVTWNASPTNGTPVTGYKVTASPQQTIQTGCILPNGMSAMSVVHDNKDNEYIVGFVSGGMGGTYSLIYCSAAGVSKTIATPDIAFMGSLANATMSGTTASFYLSNTVGTTLEVDRYTVDVSAASPTLSRTTIFTLPSVNSIRQLAMNADASVFYGVTSDCGMNGCTNNLQQYVLSSGTGSPKVVTPKVVTSQPMTSGLTFTSLLALAVDSNGALWVSVGTQSIGMASTYSNGTLRVFNASSLSALGQTPLSADTTYAVDSSLGAYTALGNGPAGYLFGGTLASQGTSGVFGNSLRKISISDGSSVSVAGVGGPDGYVAPARILGLSVDDNGNLVAGSQGGSMSGSYIFSYLTPINSQPPGGTCTGVLISGSSWGCTITGLYSNFYYSISVAAQVSYLGWLSTLANQWGAPAVYSRVTLTPSSTTSLVATAYATAPNIPPPAVTGVTASQDSKGVTASWTPGSDPTKPTASTYTVGAYSPSTATTPTGFCTVASPATTCTITGLPAGTYTIKVSANNDYTATHANTAPSTSAPTTVTVTTPPGAPTSVTATPGANSATVTWTAPSNLGGASAASITYAVTAVPTGQGSTGTCVWSSGTTASCTGLSTTTSYNFSVVASNSAGAGPAGVTTTAVTPLAPPGTTSAPTLVTGNGGLLVTGALTQTTGIASPGSQVIVYTATAYDPQSRVAGVCTYTDPTAGCAITGLANGTSYTVTVTATNSAGISGAASNASTGIPAGAPGAPTALAVVVPATVGGQVANLSWAAPVFTGGSGIALTGYLITASPGDGTCSVTTIDPMAPSQQGTCTGLVNGTNYTFTVVAENGVGSAIQLSPSSDAITTTVAALPAAPTITTVKGGDVSVAVTWTAPSTTGGVGVVISSYSVQAYQNGSPVQGKTCTTNGALTCTVFGLTNGQSYTFKVTAANLIGTGAASSASSPVSAVAPPSSAPSQPTLTATSSTDHKSINLSWSSSLCTAGNKCATGGKTYPVTGYVVVSSPAGATCTSKSGSTVSTATQNYNCVGTPGVTYSFQVAATNKPSSGTIPSDIGQGPYSNSTTGILIQGVPMTPQNLNIAAKNGNITVSFSLDTTSALQTGGSPIMAFAVTATDPTSAVSGGTCSPGSLTGTNFICTISGLSSVTAFNLSITATNSFGASVPATATGIIPALSFMALCSTAYFQIAVGGNGSISRSLDGGSSWSPTPDSAPTLSNLNAVSCTLSVCVAVGDNGTILEAQAAYTKANPSQTPTYTSSSKTLTVKVANSGLLVGQKVWVDGSALNAALTVASVSSSQFTITGVAANPNWTTSTLLDWVTPGPKSWTAVSSSTTQKLNAVACTLIDGTSNSLTGSTLCFVGGEGGVMQAWTWAVASPTALTSVAITGTNFSGSANVNAITCPLSLSYCLVAGGNGQVGTVTRPSTASASPAITLFTSSSITNLGTKAINALKCPSGYCMAVGQGGLILTDGKSATPAPNSVSSWQVVTGPQSTYDLNGLACFSTNLCVAVGAHGTVEVATSTGTALAGNTAATWKTIPTGVTYDLNNVRCLAIGCIAAGVGHLVLLTPPATATASWKVRPIS